jgi:hypothetical protein
VRIHARWVFTNPEMRTQPLGTGIDRGPGTWSSHAARHVAIGLLAQFTTCDR